MSATYFQMLQPKDKEERERGREREREGERKEGTFGEKMRETAIKQERQNTDKLFNLD